MTYVIYSLYYDGKNVSEEVDGIIREDYLQEFDNYLTEVCGLKKSGDDEEVYHYYLSFDVGDHHGNHSISITIEEYVEPKTITPATFSEVWSPMEE